MKTDQIIEKIITTRNKIKDLQKEERSLIGKLSKSSTGGATRSYYSRKKQSKSMKKAWENRLNGHAKKVVA